MPRAYEKMRDKFAKSMSYDAAQAKAARIYNSKHKSNPVGRHEKGLISRKAAKAIKRHLVKARSK